MVFKHANVVGLDANFVDFVSVLLDVDESGQQQEHIQNYILQPGERLLDTPPPAKRMYTGGEGLVCPRWNGTAWEESATPAEIAAWEAEHPAPPMLPAPPPDPRDLAITQLMREVAALKAKEAEHIG